VNGCFWHYHANCRLGALPKSKLTFWRPKLEGNRKRDRRNIDKLRKLGWSVLVVWQCSLKTLDTCMLRITRFLEK